MSNSLAAVHPELIVEWSDRNLPLTPDSVTFGSNKKVYRRAITRYQSVRTKSLAVNPMRVKNRPKRNRGTWKDSRTS